jgi:hypothetical protein
MQAPGAQAYQILVHDDHSHGWGGIKETAAQPCLRDRARMCEISDIHSQSTHRVTFNLDRKRVYHLPPEDRKSDWIQRAADRFRFQRPIQYLEKLLGPLMLKRKAFKH